MCVREREKETERDTERERHQFSASFKVVKGLTGTDYGLVQVTWASISSIWGILMG